MHMYNCTTDQSIHQTLFVSGRNP